MVSVTSDAPTKTLAQSGSSPQTGTAPPSSHSASQFSEDWLAMCIGLLVFALSLALLFGVDLLGWGITTSVWTSPAKALGAASKNYAALPAVVSLIGTFLFMLVILGFGAKRLGFNIKKFATGFAVVFGLSYLCWFLGSWAYIAATPNTRGAFKIGWSLNLTNESGFIIALLFGLFIGNFLPGVAEKIKEAIRPELYIKSGIVILGGFLGIAALDQRALATSVMFRGICAIIEAYLIYWPLVYFVSRKYFGFSREWAAPLASGISICGVSAAIATGGAIRARAVVPVMVSSLVVVFSVVELLILPFAAQHFLWHEPMVAGAWMGLAVKTDGAAVASGAIADALIRARAATSGIYYSPGWVMNVAATVKVFIDIFIGVWAFVLAWVWAAKFDKTRKPGDKVKAKEIWQRFPKFVLGYVATFVIVLAIGIYAPNTIGRVKSAMGQANVFRGIFFVMTFFSIGVVSNFRKLWEEGIGRLAAVYVLCLFGYIIWIGLAISWLFFHGMLPPLLKG